MAMTRSRRIPLVFRTSGLLLLVSAVGGQVWQRQPGGTTTRLLLGEVARRCPSAAFQGSAPTIADGAHAFDRATLRLIADRYAARPVPRCRARAGGRQAVATNPQKHGAARQRGRERRSDDARRR